jgi:hypothetical protein
MTKAVILCILSVLGSPQGDRNRAARWIHYYSRIYNVPAELVISVAYHESRCKHILSENRTRDIGFMQVNMQWEKYCRKICRKNCSLRRIRDNIRMGVLILAMGRDRGNALKFYNPGNPRYEKRVKKKLGEVKLIAEQCAQMKR